jgi:hypothetical protein
MEGKMKITIGYDGSASADAALDDLRQASFQNESKPLRTFAPIEPLPLKAAMV